MRGSGPSSRPTPTATASRTPTPACRRADGFALLDLAEAERIRALGWRGPVLLLEGCFEARDLELCSRLNLWHVIHREEQIDWLAAHKTAQPQRVFLKMNSGMNRLGFRPAAYRSAWLRLSGLTQVEDIVLMTHFADADGAAGIAAQQAGLRGRGGATCRASGRCATARPRCASRRGAPRCAPTGCAPASWSTDRRPTSRRTTSRTGSCSRR